MIRRAPSPVAIRGALKASDPEIMLRLSRGEVGALGEPYDRYHEALRRFVARATQNAHDVDDLVHETLLEAARSAPRYDGRASCRPWLFGIAVQLLRRRRRSLGRLVAALSALGGTRTGNADPRHALQARSDVERALARLSEKKRIAFLMAELEDLSCEEIASALRIPIGTVWTRLHAARRELRRMLDGSEP